MILAIDRLRSRFARVAGVLLLALTGLALLSPAALALDLEIVGAPEPKGTGLQHNGSEVMHRVDWFHNLLVYLIVAISIFVTVVLIYAMIRFRHREGVEPKTFTHNVPLEVVWTTVPILILVVVGVFSIPLIYFQDEVPKTDVTVNVTGYQWYWGYEYPDIKVNADDPAPDAERINIDPSVMVPEALVRPELGHVRLLSVDNPLVVPVGKVVEFRITAADVLHSFALPSLGIKRDSVPGQVNSSWTQIDKPGIYFGQCSELCGKDHAYMPIEVRAVEPAVFDQWVAAVRAAAAAGNSNPIRAANVEVLKMDYSWEKPSPAAAAGTVPASTGPASTGLASTGQAALAP